MTLHDAQQLMGVIKNPKAPNLPTRINKPVDLPTDFDSREKWGDACPSVKEIRDQGSTLCPHVYPCKSICLEESSDIYLLNFCGSKLWLMLGLRVGGSIDGSDLHC